MSRHLYRYTFPEDSEPEDVEAALLLALFAAESLHGESRVRLETCHALDAELRTCVIDGRGEIGRNLNQFFVGFLRREFGEDSFRVERISGEPVSVRGVP